MIEFQDDCNTTLHNRKGLALCIYLFRINTKGNLIKCIKIMHTETLNEDMKDYGYDLVLKLKVGKSVNYMSYLNTDSISFINEMYTRDFELFDYEKIHTL